MNPDFSDELIGAYLDGELTAAERAEVEQVLATSAEHRQTLEELRLLRGELQSLPRVRLPENFAEVVLKKAEAKKRSLDGVVESNGAGENSAGENSAGEKQAATTVVPVAPAATSSVAAQSASSARKVAGSWKVAIAALSALAGSLLLLLVLPPVNEEGPIAQVDAPTDTDRDDRGTQETLETASNETASSGFSQNERGYGDGRESQQGMHPVEPRNGAPANLQSNSAKRDADFDSRRARFSTPPTTGNSRYAKSGEGKPAGAASGPSKSGAAKSELTGSEKAKDGNKDRQEGGAAGKGLAGKGNAAPGGAGRGGTGLAGAGPADSNSTEAEFARRKLAEDFADEFQAALKEGRRDFYVQIEVAPEEMKRWVAGKSLPAEHFYYETAALADAAPKANASGLADAGDARARASDEASDIRQGGNKNAGTKTIDKTKGPATVAKPGAAVADPSRQATIRSREQLVLVEANPAQVVAALKELSGRSRSLQMVAVPTAGMRAMLQRSELAESRDRAALADATQPVAPRGAPADLAKKQEGAFDAESKPQIASAKPQEKQLEPVEHAHPSVVPSVPLVVPAAPSATTPSAPSAAPPIPPGVTPRPAVDSDKLGEDQLKKSVDRLSDEKESSKADSLKTGPNKRPLAAQAPAASPAPATAATGEGYLAKPRAEHAKLLVDPKDGKFGTAKEKTARGTAWNLDAQSWKLREGEAAAQPQAASPQAESRQGKQSPPGLDQPGQTRIPQPSSGQSSRMELPAKEGDIRAKDPLSTASPLRVRVLFIVREAAK